MTGSRLLAKAVLWVVFRRTSVISAANHTRYPHSACFCSATVSW
jgi:hypothetical protein